MIINILRAARTKGTYMDIDLLVKDGYYRHRSLMEILANRW